MPTLASNYLAPQGVRTFSASLEVKQEAEAPVDAGEVNRRLGVDTVFSEQKHAYVLTFPWNFQQVLSQYENIRPLSQTSLWSRLIYTNAVPEFNSLYLQFHQACAIPNYEQLTKILEGRLNEYVSESVKRIHFHGLDIEMANLTVEQPKLKLLKVELSHGVNVERGLNAPASEYTAHKSTLFGAPLSTYVPKNDTRSFLDHLDSNHRPYVLAATVLIESPMKLYVQNQNFSSILFGSNDEESVKNVVRFEANVRWLDLMKVLPVENKAPFQWKITDINNVLNENPVVP